MPCQYRCAFDQRDDLKQRHRIQQGSVRRRRHSHMTTDYEPNLLDPELMANPRAGFARMREFAPVCLGKSAMGSPVWYVTGAAEVRTVLSDPRFVTRIQPAPGEEDTLLKNLAAIGVRGELTTYVTGMLINFSGAEHARLRNLVSSAFTARRVANFRPRIEEITKALLDEVEAAGSGPVDLIDKFAYPLPIAVICELVGVHESDRPAWREWGDGLVSMTAERTPAALEGMVGQVKELVAKRRAEPADDLVSALLRAQADDGDRLSDDELITLVINIVFAGHETTAHLIGNATAALLTHPDQLELLRKEPERWPTAVHEFLRLWTPFPVSPLRYATETLELGGRTINAGEAVLAILLSANTDPNEHSCPERFDVTRREGKRSAGNFGFGHGVHYCLGAPLGRLEAEVGLSALFQRFPDLALEGEPSWTPHPLMIRLPKLAVSLGR
ncbi:cytochrome P450 [Streptomyces sp. NPDC052101]|uniref:cytochrome P450 family protein n=1 Tax=Streptomyces sp. NPDC052101 TaxID=3155763 RepID=UPI0034404C61